MRRLARWKFEAKRDDLDFTCLPRSSGKLPGTGRTRTPPAIAPHLPATALAVAQVGHTLEFTATLENLLRGESTIRECQELIQ